MGNRAKSTRHWDHGEGWVLGLASMGIIAFLAVPIAALLLSFFTNSGLSHLHSEMAVRALWLTMRTTLISTALCVILGTPMAYLLARKRFPGKGILDTLVDLPVVVPPVVAGVALLLAFGRRGLIGRHLEAVGIEIGFTTVAVIMAQVFIASPFFIRAARAGFEGVDRELERAAYTLGAGRWRTFWVVTVPLAGPSLTGGLVLAWARALSEFGATMMFAGNFPGRTQTLTLAVMTAMESDLDTAVAVSVLSLALAVATLVTAKAFLGRWEGPHG
ncbi:MAG TPA: ABC transporter permease [Armatimonadota bacterium]|jgi:molybdate transport system permease protein